MPAGAGCLRDSLGVCAQRATSGESVTLVWPPHAATIAWLLLLLAFVVIVGWWRLRGEACYWCGREGCDTCGLAGPPR